MRDHLAISQIRIFWALIRRDMHVLKKNLHSRIIDSGILVATNTLVFGKLFPLIGMPEHFIAPLFLGSSINMMLLSFGYGFALKIVYDVQYDRFIDYHMTLPITKFWLFFSYIISFIIEALIITIPLLSLGIILLSEEFSNLRGNWIIFFSTYLLSLGLIAILFLSFSFYYDFEWFRKNLWARRLNPLFTFSTTAITWKGIALLMPRASVLIQINPLTLVAEGLRSSLLGGSDYLPLGFCIIGLTVWIIVLSWALKIGINKRLDPI